MKEGECGPVLFFAFICGTGMAILHLGGHYHAALPIESGERINLVVWVHARYGVVRVKPYDKREQEQACHPACMRM